jgi:ADP-ribosylglycohydrolase
MTTHTHGSQEDSMENATEDTILFDKIYASMLAGAVGDAMGGPIEGWHYERIVETYGVLDTLLPYSEPPRPTYQFSSEAGVITDDTRLKHILCEAIVARGGLPRRGDLVRACAEAFYTAGSELERCALEEYVLGGFYGEDKLIWGGQMTNGFIMMNSPLGLICPCDPEAAFALSYDMDFISDGYAKYSAAIAAAAVSAAMRPQATVASIVEESLAACQGHRAEGELTRGLQWYARTFQTNETLVKTAVDIATRHGDVFSLRAEYYDKLKISTFGPEAAQSLAVALGMLIAADGDLSQAIIGCVNYGRDNDSYATVAGAIAGALHGTSAIPSDWRTMVEAANPEPDMHALSLGLAEVAQQRLRKLQTVIADGAPLARRVGSA